MMGKIKFSPLGKRSFIVSFLLGALLLFAFWLIRAEFLLELGFYYVLVTAVINMFILLHELIIYLTDVSEQKASGNSVLLLLVNIPITTLYLYIMTLFPWLEAVLKI
ncbi:hypothetical protein REB14_12185 [Chryseobacterium sp. ES2]|uniref:Diacylglycerol kinase n=1 Tax=Chryseobacterium metallicongregator TaxID=3073042 RepID=A0ABU1E549_9FLAO|nr:hypothetical protein [Chryseobacterium sp. ES2]MDR4952933.1 hypothetical protein [Chryseobacterium sp. ES2]